MLSVPEFAAAGTALIAVLGEWMHARRISRVRRLAFGPAARPAAWTLAAPALRVVALAAACWGFLSLWLVVEPRVHNTGGTDDADLRHLVIVMDVSPSMHLDDAGPAGDQARRLRASDLVESLFARIPMRQFKITLIGVYSEAKPLLEASNDHEVIRHILETMPMWHAFKPGKTNLLSGIELAAEMAKPWNPDSASILLLTDGDTVPATGMPALPASVKDVIVVGVGDPNSGRFIHDHQSRQDVATLRQIATRLRGIYHNGNRKHLTSQIVGKLVTATQDRNEGPWTRREWALAAIVAGSAVLAALPLLLHYFGTGYRGGTQIVRTARDAA
jgi:Ca-activated chloride channel family protein